jgi:hypothetical protein
MAGEPIDITNAANTPKSASSDGESVEQHSLKDKIEAEKFRSNQAAASSPFNALKRRTFAHPNAV